MINGLVKPLNLLLSGYSFLKSSSSGHASLSGMPPAIGIELTNYCNLHCPECASGSGLMKRQRGFMDIDLFDRIISELKPYLWNINLYFQGESLLHPLFFSFISKCRGIRSVISTNGHFLTEENSGKIARSGLSKLIISLDGVDQKTYGTYRISGNVETVIEGIRNISNARKKFNSSLKVEIQVLVNKHNEHQIPEIRKLAAANRTALKLKSMQILSSNSFESWLPEDEKFRRYTLRNGEYILKSSQPDRCARLWFNPVVTWDGKVLPCCFDKDAEHIMGDLNQESFSDIWSGAKYRLFRRVLLSGRGDIEICRNCTSGMRGVNV
ncbi:MAG: SPASM domain-containing protein [Bacteroidales bacterium]|nr:SPASM domain-containing protein [Bacteroidales bacterium]